MSQDLLLPQNFTGTGVSTVFKSAPIDNDLGEGITGSFAVVSYRGKVWAIKHGGTETKLMRADGDGPRSSIDVVIVKASKYISKVYYSGGYVPGSDQPPDCFSNNGIQPDISVVNKVSPNCALCPMNAWGSKKNAETGKDSKACVDAKRLVVVPADDIENRAWGGPMLLRVPAMSLVDTKKYGEGMAKLGYPYYTIVSRISFDANEAFPKLVYQAIRPLSDDDAIKIVDLRNDAQTETILAAVDITQVQPVNETEARQMALNAAFVEPPAATAPSPRVVATPKPVVTAPVTAAPVEDSDADLAKQLAALQAEAEKLEKAKAAQAAQAAQKKAAEDAAKKAAAAAAKKAADEAAAKAAAVVEVDPQAALKAQIRALQEKLKGAATPVTIEATAVEIEESGDGTVPAKIDSALDKLLAV